MATIMFFVFVGLTLGNFVFQALAKHEWGKAIERSFFQGIALVVAYICLALGAH